MALQHLRSSTASKRPLPASMSDGQLAVNTNNASPGLFFKDSSGNLVKAGPVHVGTTAPNASPASGGATGNSTGELWLDTSVSPNQLKTWNGSAWVSDFPDEIPVAKLADGAARQLLQTDAAGTGVEWTSNVDVPGTLDVTSTATFDSIAQHPLGSAAAPTITFTGDTNTGIYSPGADQVAISTNSVGRLFVAADGTVSVKGAGTAAFSVNGGAPNNSLVVDSNGRVGLGTSAPAQTLHVKSADTAGSIISIFDDSGATSVGRFQIRTSGGANTDAIRLEAVNRNLLQLGAANNPQLTINTVNGNVGVGTTSPGSTFDCRGAVTIVDNTTSSLFIKNNTGDSTGLLLYSNNAGESYIRAGYGPLVFRGASSDYGRWDSSGRLLVGTSSGIASTVFANGQTITLAGSQGIHNTSNDAFGSSIEFTKKRGSAIVQNGDTLGNVFFEGFDGIAPKYAAWIQGQVDGTPGANDMPGRLVFSTTADGASSPTERMRITSTGSIWINTTSATVQNSGGAVIIGDSTGSFLDIARNANLAGRFGRFNSDGSVVAFNRDATTVGSISVTTTATAYNTSSDYRLKENVTAVTDGIIRLQQLKPSRFNFIADPTKTVDGFLAHEVQTVVPEAITGEKDAVDDEGNPQYQGIDQSKMVPLVVAALQECIKKVEALEAEVASLKAGA